MPRPCEQELEHVDDLAGGDVERELSKDDGEQQQLQPRAVKSTTSDKPKSDRDIRSGL